jgi:hypothetical protein
MEERSSHLTVVIGASAVADELRRSLVNQGVIHAGVTTHLRGLRQMMALGETDLVVICIALDRATLNRHGTAVRQLLADNNCFPHAVRSVGLLTEIGLTSELAEVGCDVFVHDSSEASNAIELIARHWQMQKSQQQLEAKDSVRECQIERNAWVWGVDGLPEELSALISDEAMAQDTMAQDTMGSSKNSS